MHPEEKVLIAVVNNRTDWEIVQSQRWYRLPTRHAPPGSPHFDWVAFYFTRRLGDDGGAVHYFAAIEGHELVTRRDLFPDQQDHPRAGQWYYRLQLGPLQHRIPPIASQRWRRFSFITTSGDRFMSVRTLDELRSPLSPHGQPFVQLRDELASLCERFVSKF